MNVQAVLKKIAWLVLVLYDAIEKGTVGRDSDVEFFKSHIPNAMALQIKEAECLLQVDQPAEVLQLITQWRPYGTDCIRDYNQAWRMK